MENESLSEFISAIGKYLKYPNVLTYQSIQPWSNVKRESLIEILCWIDELTPEIIISSGLFNDNKHEVKSILSRLREILGDSSLTLKRV